MKQFIALTYISLACITSSAHSKTQPLLREHLFTDTGKTLNGTVRFERKFDVPVGKPDGPVQRITKLAFVKENELVQIHGSAPLNSITKITSNAEGALLEFKIFMRNEPNITIKEHNRQLSPEGAAIFLEQIDRMYSERTNRIKINPRIDTLTNQLHLEVDFHPSILPFIQKKKSEPYKIGLKKIYQIFKK